MRQMHWAGWLTIVAAVAAVLVISTGCEDDPSDAGTADYFSNNPYQSASRPSTQGPAAPDPVPISISPGSVSFARPGQYYNFNTTGGNAPFTWQVGTPAVGSVTSQGDSSYGVYLHLGSTNDYNNVIVTDSSGATAIANIN